MSEFVIELVLPVKLSQILITSRQDISNLSSDETNKVRIGIRGGFSFLNFCYLENIDFPVLCSQ